MNNTKPVGSVPAAALAEYWISFLTNKPAFLLSAFLNTSVSHCYEKISFCCLLHIYGL